MNQPNKNRAAPKSKGVVSSFADVVADVTGLAELQFQLLKIDAGESAHRLRRTIVVGAAMAAILLGTVPILLLLLASLLYEQFELSITLSLLISAGISLTGVAIGGLITVQGLKSVPDKFSRSATELQRNVQWLKNLKSTSNNYAVGDPLASRASQNELRASKVPPTNGAATGEFRNFN